MANSVWPATLPQYVLLGATDGRMSAVIRTATDGGPAKVRRRYTSTTRVVSTPMIFTTAQRSTFDTFFITTLKEGSLEFDWFDPNDGTLATMRFLSPPKFSVVGYAGAFSPRWKGKLDLEVLPS